MRIIGGELGGRRITAPPGRGTRPMLDRVREAMFSTLGERIPDGKILDLFSGSGSLGIEALSRGAAHARFVERSSATARILEENLAELGLTERAEVLRADALAPESWGTAAPDVVFFDPPYPLLESARPKVLGALARLAGEVVAPSGTVVFHAPRGAVLQHEIGSRPGVPLEARERHYGSNALWYVSPGATKGPGEDKA